MRVYITDLEAYNNGHLVGSWYDLPMHEDLLAESIENELQKGKAICRSKHFHEEYFITDYECSYMKIDEYANITELNEIAEKMEELDDEEVVAITLLLENNLVSDLNEALNHLDDIYCTNETKMEDIAFNYIEESGALSALPENLQFYFDYEALGRDMEINGSYFEDEQGVLWEYTL